MKAHVRQTTTVTTKTVEVISEVDGDRQCTDVAIKKTVVLRPHDEFGTGVTYSFRLGRGENERWISETEARALVECLKMGDQR